MMWKESLAFAVMLGVPALGVAQSADTTCAASQETCPATSAAKAAVVPTGCCDEVTPEMAALQEVGLQAVELEALKALGYVSAVKGGFLGVYLDPEDTSTNGVSISGVVEGSAAEKAGLQAGDRIVQVGDHEVATAEDLRSALAHYEAGDKVAITFFRGDDRHRSKVTLGEREEGEEYEEEMEDHEVHEVIEILEEPIVLEKEITDFEMPMGGMVLRAIGEGSGYLGVSIEAADKGIGVSQVMPGTAAEAAGIRAGDVITSLNGSPVSSTEELVELVSASKPGTQVKIGIRRGSHELHLVATLGTRELSPEGNELRELEIRALELNPDVRFERPATIQPGRIQIVPSPREVPTAPRAVQDQVGELRRQVEQLRAENMKLQEALKVRERARAQATPDDDLRQRLDQMGQALRKQNQAIEELKKALGERRNPAPSAGMGGMRLPVAPTAPAPPAVWKAEADEDGDAMIIIQGQEGAPQRVRVRRTGSGMGGGAIGIPRKADDQDAKEGVRGVIRIQTGDQVKEIDLSKAIQDAKAVHNMPKEFTFHLGEGGTGKAVIRTEGDEHEMLKNLFLQLEDAEDLVFNLDDIKVDFRGMGGLGGMVGHGHGHDDDGDDDDEDGDDDDDQEHGEVHVIRIGEGGNVFQVGEGGRDFRVLQGAGMANHPKVGARVFMMPGGAAGHGAWVGDMGGTGCCCCCKASKAATSDCGGCEAAPAKAPAADCCEDTAPAAVSDCCETAAPAVALPTLPGTCTAAPASTPAQVIVTKDCEAGTQATIQVVTDCQTSCTEATDAATQKSAAPKPGSCCQDGGVQATPVKAAPATKKIN